MTKGTQQAVLAYKKGNLEQDVYDALVNWYRWRTWLVTRRVGGPDYRPFDDSVSRQNELTSQPRREQRLKEAVKKIKDDYDYSLYRLSSFRSFNDECFYR